MDGRSEPLDVIEAIFTTGAQRRLKPDPIPERKIWAILDAAIRGPSSGNGQRWSWLVVTDDDVKRRIAAWYLDAWNALSMGRRARLRRFIQRLIGPVDVAVEEAPPDPNLRSGVHLAHNIGTAPVWVFAVVHGVKGSPSVVDGADIFGAVAEPHAGGTKLRSRDDVDDASSPPRTARRGDARFAA